MARTKDKAAAADMGRNLMRLHRSTARAKNQRPSYSEIALAMALKYHVVISAEQVRRYHIGDVDPHDANIEHMAALSGYYDVGISALSSVAYDRLIAAFDLLNRQMRCLSRQA